MFSRPPLRCEPPPWARGGHAQTVLGALLPVGRPAPGHRSGYRSVRLPVQDGGALQAWHRDGPRDPVVVLWHGLGGSTAAPYMRLAAARAASLGHPVLAVNHRGSGGPEERTSRPYMTGNTQDMADVLLWTRLRHRGRPVCMLGFSLSGNTLLKWLGGGARELPESALAVNPSIDLDETSRHLLAWPQHAYDLWLLRRCRRWVPRLRGETGASYRVPALSSLREFDARYIAPVWGFPDRESYYRQASGGPHLVNIDRPTAILTAGDDPITGVDHLARTPRSASVALHVEPHGGHLGYLHGGGGSTGRWLEYAVGHYLDQAAELAAATPAGMETASCAP